MYLHHSFADKLRAVRLYESGLGCDLVGRELGIGSREILRWVRAYEQLGESGLRRQGYHCPTAAFKSEVVGYVFEKGVSCDVAALQYGVSRSAVESWVRKVKLHGYASLQITKPRGRPPKPMGRPKKREPQTELEKLRARNEWLEAENALLKKVKALVEKQDARLRKLGRKPSKD